MLHYVNLKPGFLPPVPEVVLAHVADRALVVAVRQQPADRALVVVVRQQAVVGGLEVTEW